MKKFILLLFITVLGITITTAQEINTFSSRGVEDLANGWHKFITEGVVFDVEVENGILQKGNITWFDGSTYSGQLSNFGIYGKGTYTWPDNSRYEGAFKKNQRHGKGSMIQIDGSKWSGKWKNNQKNGKGKAFDAQGNLITQGVWKDDVLIEK